MGTIYWVTFALLGFFIGVLFVRVIGILAIPSGILVGIIVGFLIHPATRGN
jgi:hypothetical protein